MLLSSTRSWRHLLPAIFGLWLWAQPHGLEAAEAAKEKEKKPEPPVLLIPLPLGVATGVTNKVILRGQRLKQVTSIKLGGLSVPTEVHRLKQEDAKVPEGSSAAKAGDQQLEIQFFLPESGAVETNGSFVVESPAGVSKPLPTWVIPASQLIDEKEPNDGFKQAQSVPSGSIIRGLIGEGVDVDVFKIAGKTGHILHIEVIASRLGSTLDSSLTLYDAKGAVMASNDDGEGRDSILAQKLPLDGDYFVALTSVNERPSKTHVYLLRLSESP